MTLQIDTLDKTLHLLQKELRSIDRKIKTLDKQLYYNPFEELRTISKKKDQLFNDFNKKLITGEVFSSKLDELRAASKKVEAVTKKYNGRNLIDKKLKLLSRRFECQRQISEVELQIWMQSRRRSGVSLQIKRPG